MLLIDLTHTSHTTARTGVQRVSRSLYESLKKTVGAEAITHDPYEKIWRRLRPWERANLQSEQFAKKRGAQWPWPTKAAGLFRRVFAGKTSRLTAEGLVVPEIFSASTASQFPRLWTDVKGPKIAIFHDAIALKLPELTPQKTVARFPAYLQDLLAFDGIAAVSEDSRQSLLDYWRWLGVSKWPAIRTIPLGSTQIPANSDEANAPPKRKPVVLSVGTIEGRKNHLTLLAACENLWGNGLTFQLRVVGLSHPETGWAALERIGALQRAGRDLRYDGAVSDQELETAYGECEFTVYPSLMEGFGLPVLESVYRGKACICSDRGALSEAAKGGGCLTLDPRDAAALARAIESLLVHEELRAKLCAAARLRPQRTWDMYATELVDWLREFQPSR